MQQNQKDKNIEPNYGPGRGAEAREHTQAQGNGNGQHCALPDGREQGGGRTRGNRREEGLVHRVSSGTSSGISATASFRRFNSSGVISSSPSRESRSLSLELPKNRCKTCRTSDRL